MRVREDPPFLDGPKGTGYSSKGLMSSPGHLALLFRLPFVMQEPLVDAPPANLSQRPSAAKRNGQRVSGACEELRLPIDE